MEQKPGKREIVLLIMIFLLILAVWLGYRFMRAGADTGGKVRITVDGEEYGVYNLYEDQEIPIEIDGEVTNTLIIVNGEADMIEADCPDQICVNMDPISAEGETIICLPNKIVAEVIESEEESEVDVIAQ